MRPNPSRWPPGYTPGPRLHTFEVQGPDGRVRMAHLLMAALPTTAVPLILSPHPFGLTSLINLFGTSPGPRTTVALEGLGESACTQGAAVMTLESEGRILCGASLGWRPHLESYFQAIELALRAGHELNPKRIGAVGLSMGGLEALLLAALWPGLVRAVAVQNAIIDLEAWHADLLATPGREQVADAIAKEVGGTPADMAAEYAARSPRDQLLAFAPGRTHVRYSRCDTVVRAETQVLAAVRDGVIAPSQVVEETRHQLSGQDPGRSAHEYINWSSCVDFVLGALAN